MSTISKEVKFKLMKKFDKENKKSKHKEKPKKVDDKNKIVYEKTLTVEELTGKLNKDISEIIKKLMFSGVMETKNEDLSDDAIELIAEDYGFTVEKKKVIEET